MQTPPVMNDLPQRMPAYGMPSSNYATSSAASSNYAASSSPATSSGVPSPYDVPLPGVTAASVFAAPDANAAGARPSESAAAILDRIDSSWSWQILPDGLMYRSYMAGRLEPRLGSDLVYQRGYGWYWDAQVGARVGLFRYGDNDPIAPQGWQFDVEGAAFPRLDLEANENLDCVDFRGGFLLTNRTGMFETKFGFYHLSSHLGDEYMIANPDYTRINYVRESLIAGVSIHPARWLRLYGEVGWTFQEDGGAQPWEFQFGVEAASPDVTGPHGTPFLAVNAHLRQENNFGGNVNTQLGWLWRGPTGRTFRVGVEYFNGMSEEYQNYNVFEDQIGVGLWYDF
jgi:hypothetical protein